MSEVPLYSRPGAEQGWLPCRCRPPPPVRLSLSLSLLCLSRSRALSLSLSLRTLALSLSRSPALSLSPSLPSFSLSLSLSLSRSLPLSLSQTLLDRASRDRRHPCCGPTVGSYRGGYFLWARYSCTPAVRASMTATFFFSSLLLSSLELSDAQVYEPFIRAPFGTASHFCRIVVLKLRTCHHPSPIRTPSFLIPKPLTQTPKPQPPHLPADSTLGPSSPQTLNLSPSTLNPKT